MIEYSYTILNWQSITCQCRTSCLAHPTAPLRPPVSLQESTHGRAANYPAISPFFSLSLPKLGKYSHFISTVPFRSHSPLRHQLFPVARVRIPSPKAASSRPHCPPPRAAQHPDTTFPRLARRDFASSQAAPMPPGTKQRKIAIVGSRSVGKFVLFLSGFSLSLAALQLPARGELQRASAASSGRRARPASIGERGQLLLASAASFHQRARPDIPEVRQVTNKNPLQENPRWPCATWTGIS